jgi:hypothetical protein
VLLALYSGVFWGCFVMYRYSLVAAFKHSFSEFILEAIADADHVYVIVFSWLLAGMVGIPSPHLSPAEGLLSWGPLATTPSAGSHDNTASFCCKPLPHLSLGVL